MNETQNPSPATDPSPENHPPKAEIIETMQAKYDKASPHQAGCLYLRDHTSTPISKHDDTYSAEKFKEGAAAIGFPDLNPAAGDLIRDWVAGENKPKKRMKPRATLNITQLIEKVVEIHAPYRDLGGIEKAKADIVEMIKDVAPEKVEAMKLLDVKITDALEFAGIE